MIRPTRISSHHLQPSPDYFGTHAYLINLVRRPDRLAQALEQFSKQKTFAPEVFAAVDGRTLPIPEGWEAGPGALGCNRSHVAVLADAVAKGRETVTVFEDDVVLCHDFDRRFLDFMWRVPKDWDAVFLGGQWMLPASQVVPGVLRATAEKGIHRTHAYVIRGKYLSFMLDEWKSKPGHIDHVWGRNQRDWRVYAPEHWLCAQAASFSDISRRHNPEKWWTHRRITPQPVPTPAVRPQPSTSDGCSSCERLRRLREQMAKGVR